MILDLTDGSASNFAYIGDGVECLLTHDREHAVIAVTKDLVPEEDWDAAVDFARANGFEPAGDDPDFTIGEVDIYVLREITYPPLSVA